MIDFIFLALSFFLWYVVGRGDGIAAERREQIKKMLEAAFDLMEDDVQTTDYYDGFARARRALAPDEYDFKEHLIRSLPLNTKQTRMREIRHMSDDLGEMIT